MSCLCKSKASDVVDGASTTSSQDLMADGEVNGEETSHSLRAVGTDVNYLARETAELCIQTLAKGEEMVVFGAEVRDTLVGMSDRMDGSMLETIRDLIDGDQVAEARELASDMDGLARTCAEKSVQMITRMEEGVEALPDPIQKFVEKRASKFHATDEEKELANVDDDVEELETAIRDVQNLNLFSAMEAGKRAFDGLTSKASVVKILFENIKKFADAVVTISDAFMDFEVGAIISKVKDIWKCLSLTSLMKQFAEEVGKLIKVIIDLFKKAISKLGAVWAALAYAKECLSDAARHAFNAKSLTAEALDRGRELVSRTRSISEQIDKAGSLTNTIPTLQNLANGNEIQRVIELAKGMDDLVMQAMARVSIMIGRVTDGYNNLPEIITEDIPDAEEAGKDENDPEEADVEADIAELENAKRAIESSDVISASKATMEGFSGAAEKAEMARCMLRSSRGFARDSNRTIEGFMGAWNLEAATEKIIAMCRLVRLGEMMQQYADQTKKLLMAIIALMRAVMKKVSNLLHFEVPGFDAMSSISCHTMPCFKGGAAVP